MKNSNAFIATTLILIGCLCMGFWIARHRPLWNDEFYSQVSSIHNISYTDQFSGRIPEGGNAPLFYALQKSFQHIIHYQTPDAWLQGQWGNDAASQRILRINPIVFMSLSVSLVFYYFCRQYSLITAFYSLFIYISSYMLWAYWAEARPYALVVFLTTVQSIILLKKIDQDPRTDKGIGWLVLAATNILLSLTSILSFGEILAVSVLWWALKERDLRKYLLVTLLPMLIIAFYSVHAPKYQFFFGLSPEQLIRDNISRERFDVLFIFILSLAAYLQGQKYPSFKYAPSKEILKPMTYIIFLLGVLAATAAILWLFALHAKPGHGFPITSRYFIYLLPIGVISTTMVTVSMMKSLSQFRLAQAALIGLIGLLFIQHFFKIVPRAIHSLLGT
jgi:hypothetical protein